MPIFHKHKVVFIHIPKTGGCSIEHELLDKGDTIELSSIFVKDYLNGHSPQHSTYKELCDLQLIPKDYRIFTIVRHPLDRFLSEYNWQRTRFPANFLSMEQLVACKDHEFDNHLLEMYRFVEGGEIHVMRHEFLDRDFEDFFGFKLSKHLNVSTKFETNVTEKMKQKIYSRYYKDFELFGYN